LLYNLIATKNTQESEYIVGIGSFSNRTDVNTLIPFLNRIRKHTNKKFENIIADAGYESSENSLGFLLN